MNCYRLFFAFFSLFLQVESFTTGTNLLASIASASLGLLFPSVTADSLSGDSAHLSGRHRK